MAWSYLPPKFPVLPARPPRATAGVSTHLPWARMTPHLPKGRMLHCRFPAHLPWKQDYQPSSIQVLSCPLVGVARRGDIVVCPSCNQPVHALCKEGAKCFRCVCRVCDSPPRYVMRPCKCCMHRVHDACAIAVPHQIECRMQDLHPKGPATSSTGKEENSEAS